MTQSPSSHAPRSEQWRRLRETWELARPEPDAVRRAYARWSRAPTKTRSRRNRPTWALAMAMLFVGGGALAVTSALRPLVSHWQRATSSPAVGSSSTAPTKRVRTQPSLSTMPIQGVDSNPIPAQSVTLPPEPAQPEPLPARQAVTTHKPHIQPAPVATGAQSKEPVDLGSWTKVAEAMRQGDPTRVSRSLDELSASRDSATRDAARLTRAQLQVAAGHAEQARAELLDLSTMGATPLVRQRARQTLQRLSD